MATPSTSGIWLDEHNYVSFSETGKLKKLQGVQASRRTAAKSGYAFSKITSALPNPDKLLKTKGKTIEFYNDLRQDAHVASCVQSRKAGVMKLEWDIDRGIAETSLSAFIRKVFDQLDIVRFMEDALEAPYFGHEILDVYWRYENGKWLPKDIVSKPREWFSFDGNNHLIFHSKENSKGEPTHHRKYLVVQHNARYNNPYGEAILARCFWPVHFKNNALKFWLKFAEKYGMPYLYGKVKRTATDDDKDDLLELLEDFAQDGVQVITEDEEVDLLEAARSSSSDLYKTLVDFANAEISKAILSHTGSSESTPGKLGGETGAMEVRDDIVDSDARLIEKAANKLIKHVVDVNFGPTATLPYFALYKKETVDMNLVNYSKGLKEAGVQLLKPFFTKYFKLKEDEFEIKVEATPPAFDEGNKTHNHDEKPAAITADQLAVDKAVDLLASGASTEEAMAAMLEPVIKLINSGSNYEEIKEKIASLFGEMSTENMEIILSNAIFAADTAGRIAAGREGK